MNTTTCSARATVPVSQRRAARGWLVPGLLLLFGGLPVLAAIYRLVLIREGLALESLPDDFEGAAYVEHLFVALAHFVPGIAFLLLGPLQFSATFRRRWPVWHRWSGRVVVVSGLAAGISALWMNEFFPGRVIGGFLKYSAVLVFGTAFIGAIVLAVIAIVRRDIPRHRAWMVRAFAIGLGGGTQRLMLIPIFLVYGGLSDLVIGMSQWFCFGINLVIAEFILRRGQLRGARR